MKVDFLGTPCRVFAFMGAEYIPADPKDGKEKYAIGSCSGGNDKMQIVLFDPETMRGESLEVTGDSGVYALLYLPDYERLLVGTVGSYGWVHALDMKTRTWMESLRIDGEYYVWNLTRGGDGKVYGSNWPGCILYCYDPETHTLTSAGRVSKNPDNLYSRMVYTLPDGNILISVSMKELETHVFDVKTRQFRQVFEPGEYADSVEGGLIITRKSDGKRYVYDAATFELLDGPVAQIAPGYVTNPKVIEHLQNKLNIKYGHLLPYAQECHMRQLKDGRVIGMFNQQILIIKDGKISFHDPNATPPALPIHAMNVADDGVVWFAAGFGQSMGSYDPKTGKEWNSYPMTRVNGEAYGVVPHNGKVYFSTYAGGDHVVYDPAQPWDQFTNNNPKTLQSVAPMKMQRPIAGSIIGPDGNLWTGWCACYGVYGGGISRVNVQTNEVTGWYGVVPDQGIGHLAAGKEYLYATSHWMCSGLPYKFDQEFRLLQLDTECNTLWSETFPKGRFPEYLAYVDGKLYMTLRDQLDGMAKILVYDGKTMEKLTEKAMHPLGDPGKNEVEVFAIRGLRVYGQDKLVMNVDNKVHLLDAATLEILQTAQLPEMIDTMTVKDQTVYTSSMTKLFRVLFD